MLTEHLFYEVQMTFYLAWLLPNTQGTVLDPLARNAQIEAFTIHLRQLIEFLWRDRDRDARKGDAFAGDYFAPGEWANLRPERPAILSAAVHQKVGWGVAHLTCGRANSTEQDKQWNIAALASALPPAIICFTDNVDSAKLDPSWPMAQMRAWAEPFAQASA